MADRALSHLNYGHAGAPIFDLGTHEWSFGRDFTTTRLKQIGILEDGQTTASDVVPASIQFSTTAASTRLTDAKESAQALVHGHPELAPATHLVPELAITSAAVLSATATYDPSIGSLFSIGSITYRYDRGARGDKWELPKRVAATVTGEAGNILRLSFLCKEVHGWSDDRSVCIGGDTLRDTESGYWNEEAAPIQQVCFSQSEDRSRLLAVRLLTRTVVFRPIYTHPPQPAAHSPYYHLPVSPIQLHPVLSLNIEQTGGCPHADVTFNPDYQLQFAVVDQASVWSVWDIENKRQGNDHAMSCLVQGPIAEDADLAGEDGWARVLWVGDHNTLLVCNRRLMAVIDFKRGTFQRLTCPRLVSPKSSNWILDVQRHPSQRGRVFVITSTSLYILAVTTSNEAVDTTAGEVGARVLASWRHYRGAEDFTLRINAQMLHDDEVWVMVQSRLSPLTQVYTFRTSADLIAETSSANATRLDLAVDGEGHVIQSVVEPMHFEGDTESSSECLGVSYMAQGLRIYKLFIWWSDLSVHEAIVYNATRGDFDVQDVAWSKTMQVGKSVRTSSIVQKMDDFLEAERIEAMDGPVPKLASQTPEWVQREPLNAARRVVDHMQLYDVLTQKDAITIDIATVIAQLKQLLTGDSDVSDLPMGTL
jgi:RNA polymerase I-specific transcription initiation factor RRN6